jgi:hypothetical protein
MTDPMTEYVPYYRCVPMAGGELILFPAKNDDMVEGEVIKMPRSLGNGVHGLESLQPARWGRFRRFGPDQKVPTTSELVEAVKKERAKNSAKGGASAQPNPAMRESTSTATQTPLQHQRRELQDIPHVHGLLRAGDRLLPPRPGAHLHSAAPALERELCNPPSYPL